MHLVNCILIIRYYYLRRGESSSDPEQEQATHWSSLASEWHRNVYIYIYIYLCANVLKCFAKCLSIVDLCYCYEHDKDLRILMHIYELDMINHTWYRNAYNKNVKLVICWKHATVIIMKLNDWTLLKTKRGC